MSNETFQLMLLSDLPAGAVARVEIAGKGVAIYRVGDNVFATDDLCTHADASLSEEGEFEADEFKVICGWHRGSFDVRTGAVLESPCTRSIGIYRVWVEDGYVCTDGVLREGAK